jgi:hypothetical protein
MNREARGAERTAYIGGLREFADFLEANPGVPVWQYGQDIIFGTDEGRGGVDAIAALLGETPEERPDAYRVSRRFGRITYVARTAELRGAGRVTDSGPGTDGGASGPARLTAGRHVRFNAPGPVQEAAEVAS